MPATGISCPKRLFRYHESHYFGVFFFLFFQNPQKSMKKGTSCAGEKRKGHDKTKFFVGKSRQLPRGVNPSKIRDVGVHGDKEDESNMMKTLERFHPLSLSLCFLFFFFFCTERSSGLAENHAIHFSRIWPRIDVFFP